MIKTHFTPRFCVMKPPAIGPRTGPGRKTGLEECLQQAYNYYQRTKERSKNIQCHSTCSLALFKQISYGPTANPYPRTS